MVTIKNYGDPTVLRNYYKAQGGYGLLWYQGVPMMCQASVGVYIPWPI